MLRLQEGEAVKIVERPAVAADAKSGLYFAHYKNLSGTIFKLYGSGETQQAAVDVDLETLPEDVSRRHLETRDAMYQSLTGDAKKQSAPGMPGEFRLRYIVLVGVADLKRRTITSKN